MIKKITVEIGENNYAFIKWLAKRDRVTVAAEVQMLFNLQTREEYDLHEDEYKEAQHGKKDHRRGF